MESKHTPGPWSVETRHIVHAILDTKGQEITFQDVSPQKDAGSITSRGRSPEETQANARLIAAAPELLELADRMLEIIDYNRHKLNVSDFEKEIIAAIAKARGQS